MREVYLYDTTLRDGSQGEGIKFSVADKLRIAERLAAFGVHFIEGGWPGSNAGDIEFFVEARHRNFGNAQIAAFGSTRRKGVAVGDDPQVRLLLDADTPVVTIFGKTWLLHVIKVLGTTPAENLAMIAETIRFLKDHGKFVVYDAEHAFDGYKDDPKYALATWVTAAVAGADVVTLCDTNGGCLPREVERIVQIARERLAVTLGIHTHDDIGLAVANALIAVEAGATQVQGTFNGYGERTGNCNLTTLIPNLTFKMDRPCLPNGVLAGLLEVSRFVDQTANLRPNPRQPWVGTTAFAHKGGMHVNAVQKVEASFEHIDPIVVGNRRRVLVSDQAGRSNIVLKAQELGFNLTNDMPELKAILARIKQLEHKGYEFEAAEASLALIINRSLHPQQPSPFTVTDYHVSMRRGQGTGSVCEATIKVKVGEETAHMVAEGDGPVNALDSALRLALIKFYPKLESVKLTDYKVRILDSATGTAAITRALIESTDGQASWGTVGADENIIEASLRALEDGYAYALLISAKQEV